MKKFHHKRKRYRFFCLASALILMLLSIIPVRLARSPTTKRPSPKPFSPWEAFTAPFAQMHPSLEIWVSSPPEKVFNFQAAGISNTQVHIDRSALDTVTNFTPLVKDFKNRNFHHLYLLSSNFHMPQAKAIATFVLGSRDIAFTPVSVPSNAPPESWLDILHDGGRALLWIVTGKTGASLKPKLSIHAPR